MFCVDVIPPRSRQVLFILSLDIAKKKHAPRLQLQCSTHYGDGGDSAHVPALAALGELRGLHTPLPMFDVIKSAAEEEEEEDGESPASRAARGGVDTSSLADSLSALLRKSDAAQPAAEEAEVEAGGGASAGETSGDAMQIDRAAVEEESAVVASVEGEGSVEPQPKRCRSDEAAVADESAVPAVLPSVPPVVPAAAMIPAASQTTGASPLPATLRDDCEREAFGLIKKVVQNLLTKVGAKYRRLPRTNVKLAAKLFSCPRALHALTTAENGIGFTPYETHLQFEEDVTVVSGKLEAIVAVIDRLIAAYDSGVGKRGGGK